MIPYTSGNFASPVACGPPLFSAPIPGVNTLYLLTQDFMVNAASFSPIALDTPHPDNAAFLLVAESPPSDVTGLKLRWTRTYAKVPTAHTDYTTTVYNFIGLYGDVYTLATWSVGIWVENSALARLRFNKSALVKISFDYFLCAAGQTYVSPEHIPIQPATRYLGQNRTGEWLEVNYLNDTYAQAVWYATNPTRTQYLAMITADWAPVSGTWSIRCQDDELERWQGNIWCRRQFFVKAQ
jgi:hypothetical protein